MTFTRRQQELLDSPRNGAGFMLLIIQLMRAQGLTEVELDASTIDDDLGTVDILVRGTTLKVRLSPPVTEGDD